MVGGRSDRTQARPLLKLVDGAATDHWVQMPFNGTYHAGGQGNCDPKTTQDCTPSVFMLFQYLDTRLVTSL